MSTQSAFFSPVVSDDKNLTPAAHAVEANLRAAMRGYSFVGGASDTCDYPGLCVTSCGFNSAVFNAAMLTTAGVGRAEVDDFIRVAHDHYTEKSLGWTFWLCDDLVRATARPRMTALFRKHGMHVVARAPGMYTDGISERSRASVSLRFRRINDEATRLDFAHLSSAIFALPFTVARRIYGSAPFWTGPISGWVAYSQGHAVSIVTVVIGSGVAGVYSLGTLPQHQGRGFGEAVLRHALETTCRETGISISVLQATRQGMCLYQRLGYRVVTTFSVFLKEGNSPV